MTQAARGVGVAMGALLILHSVAYPLQRRKKNEDYTQTLEAAPEPPAAVALDSTRLGWRVAPLTAQGLLSQQTREALKYLTGAARGVRVVKLRAYVSGPGDLRRVSQIASEYFSERKLALPVVSVVQVGALEREGAQVAVEALVEERRAVNSRGVAFAAASGTSPGKALEALRERLERAGASTVLGLTCAVTSSQMFDEARQVSGRLFADVTMTLMQAQRLPEAPRAVCEATARMQREVGGGAAFGEGTAAVGPARLAVSGAQMAFRYQQADARLAYQRIEKTLNAMGGSLRRALVLSVYPLSEPMAELARAVGSEFTEAARPPVGETLRYEGLPSLDASFALEAVALAR